LIAPTEYFITPPISSTHYRHASLTPLERHQQLAAVIQQRDSQRWCRRNNTYQTEQV